MKPKIGVVGVPEGWSSEELADKIAEKTGFRLLIDMGKTRLDLTTGKVCFDGHDLSQLDAIIIKKVGSRYSPDLLDRLEVLRYLHEKGVKMFSKPLSIIRLLDRLSCTVTLSSGDIPMPPTVITEDIQLAAESITEFGEAVLKPLFSTKARGMLVLNKTDDLESQLSDFKKDNNTMYIQKKIELPEYDLGVVFLGGEYLTTYARKITNGAWNTTTNSGGKYAPHTPSPEIIELACRAQSLFDLDFTCVDIAETETGPIVFEVSAFGGFRGVLSTSGIDAASRYTDYVLKSI
ncbi:MAG: GAK system ATP-grasp enzyme [Proteobacteria bacterium]|nr:GAK system ATP-grasp enzyme [Pseudomonadota bacterium]